MTLITEDYLALNKELHERRPEYGISGVRWAARVAEIAKWVNAITILDYGCGKGTLGLALSHLLVRGYDPAIEGLSDEPEPADLVVCGDVLEHIEPDCLEAVLDDLKRCTVKAIFLTVVTGPAKKTLSDGRNAHLIQEPAEWWLPKIMARWELQAFHATVGEFAVFATAKPSVGNGAGA